MFHFRRFYQEMIDSFKCKHFLFVYIVKQNKNTSRIFKIKFRGFSKFYANQTLLETNILNFDHSYTFPGVL